MRDFVVECMLKVGADKVNGTKVADLLISADRRGHYRFELQNLEVIYRDVIVMD